MSGTPSLSVLFVCLGNICRSPAAEAVLRATSALGDRLTVDSAGLGNWHVGNPPTGPAIAEGARRGYDLSGLQARHFELADYDRFDVIVAMTHGYQRSLAGSAPAHLAPRVRLFGAFGPGIPHDVADPYNGTDADYAAMFEVVEATIPHLDRFLVRELAAKAGT